uniref:Uncharacterized protein n=1 Tax=Megaselia scalaris TaxID=36166 RepID=T1GCD5_MEGSC
MPTGRSILLLYSDSNLTSTDVRVQLSEPYNSTGSIDVVLTTTTVKRREHFNKTSLDLITDEDIALIAA